MEYTHSQLIDQIATLRCLFAVSYTHLFPVGLIAALWPWGLSGLWCNQPGTALLAALLAAGLLLDFRRRYAAHR